MSDLGLHCLLWPDCPNIKTNDGILKAVQLAMRLCHSQRYLGAYANIEDPAEYSGQLLSNWFLSISIIYSIQWFCKRTAKTMDYDHTAGMRRLIKVFVVRICTEGIFHMRGACVINGICICYRLRYKTTVTEELGKCSENVTDMFKHEPIIDM